MRHLWTLAAAAVLAAGCSAAQAQQTATTTTTTTVPAACQAYTGALGRDLCLLAVDANAPIIAALEARLAALEIDRTCIRANQLHHGDGYGDYAHKVDRHTANSEPVPLKIRVWRYDCDHGPTLWLNVRDDETWEPYDPDND